eukprot:4819237-Alexandrium_andersonii.AAC.1
MYALARTSEAARNVGMAVDRCTTRMAELLGVSRDALIPHKKDRSILLLPGPAETTLTAIAEMVPGTNSWRITSAGA